MPDPEHRCSFAQVIAQHWQNNFPREARSLRKAGKLVEYAERAAERAGLVRGEALAKGLSWTQAEELAVEEWGTPPTLS